MRTFIAHLTIAALLMTQSSIIYAGNIAGAASEAAKAAELYQNDGEYIGSSATAKGFGKQQFINTLALMAITAVSVDLLRKCKAQVFKTPSAMIYTASSAMYIASEVMTFSKYKKASKLAAQAHTGGNYDAQIAQLATARDQTIEAHDYMKKRANMTKIAGLGYTAAGVAAVIEGIMAKTTGNPFLMNCTNIQHNEIKGIFGKQKTTADFKEGELAGLNDAAKARVLSNAKTDEERDKLLTGMGLDNNKKASILKEVEGKGKSWAEEKVTNRSIANVSGDAARDTNGDGSGDTDDGSTRDTNGNGSRNTDDDIARDIKGDGSRDIDDDSARDANGDTDSKNDVVTDPPPIIAASEKVTSGMNEEQKRKYYEGLANAEGVTPEVKEYAMGKLKDPPVHSGIAASEAAIQNMNDEQKKAYFKGLLNTKNIEPKVKDYARDKLKSSLTDTIESEETSNHEKVTAIREVATYYGFSNKNEAVSVFQSLKSSAEEKESAAQYLKIYYDNQVKINPRLKTTDVYKSVQEYFNNKSPEGAMNDYIQFKDWMHFQEGTRNQSISLSEYEEYKKTFELLPADLMTISYQAPDGNIHKESFGSILKNIMKNGMDIMFPPAHALNLSSFMGMMGITGGAALSMTLLKKQFDTWTPALFRLPVRRAITSGASAAITMIVSKMNKKSADNYKKQADDFQELIDKLQALQTDQTQVDTGAANYASAPIRLCFSGSSTGALVLDRTCECRANNSCRSAGYPRFSGGNFSAPALLNSTSAGLNNVASQLYNGDLEGANISAGNLAGTQSAMTRLSLAAKKKMNNILKKNKQKPIDFEFQERKVASTLQKAAASALEKAGGDSAIQGSPLIASKVDPKKGNDVAKNVAQSDFEYKNAKESTASSGENAGGSLFGDFGSNTGSTKLTFAEERNIAMALDTIVDEKAQINQNKGQDIFKVISVRYLKSAFPRMLDAEKD